MKEMERKKGFIINVTYLAFSLIIFYILVRYVMYALMPFTIALLITCMLKRPVDHIARWLHLPRRGVAAVMAVLFYATIASLLTYGVFQLVMAIVHWFGNLSSIYVSNIEPAVVRVLDWYEELVATLNPDAQSQASAVVSNILESLAKGVTSISASVANFARVFALKVPSFIISMIFCIVSTVFLSMDYSKISYFFFAQFSKKNQAMIMDGKSFIISTVGGMLKSYGLIILITMTELFIGFKIIGIENAGTVAVVIAIFDILPALGTGGIMIPWVVIELIKANYSVGLKLAVLYAVITLVRNIVEPKVVGETLGLHPVLLLISIYIGGSLLGPMGIIILPFTVIVLKKLNDRGHISIFRSDYLGDKPREFQDAYKSGDIIETEKDNA